ncbi:hypothetical protein SAMN04515648_3981 [Phyllobacterium sp. CL33Tsu]|uniref:hypothetical protein n=1 Tax=Phyllobacterium sp. CL33Tsu TaxID=1798191 RepID=UPI0008EECAE3|nr:hypothetical protein [Phyllobacterium sp. CL33Tsu]SFJ42306.1 hypothetical protein SAMN04515648_3981 [Phyllobacterium sp. CL33Tsu]
MHGSGEEAREQFALLNTPLGQKWSGRARYAAAMYFNKRGELSDEALEIYRICARMDGEDPIAVLKSQHVGIAWLNRLNEAYE